jgi:YfiH family protein
VSIHRLRSKKLDGFNHGFFTRLGGISKGIYKGLNCGTGSKDDHLKVQFNRNLVASEMNITPKELITVYQVHSARVLIVDNPLEILTRADAIVTNKPNLAISVLTADCLPVLFADKKNKVVGAAHAGWKGALGGVLENTVQLMTEIGADIRNIEAVIGPCISPINYEVGQDFFDKFIKRNKSFQNYFLKGSKEEKYLFDLPKFALDRLYELEISNAEWIGNCTYQEPDKFYSYRRSQHLGELDYGRQISSIKI